MPPFSIVAVLRASLASWRRDFAFLTLLAALLEAPIVLAELVIAHGTGELPGTDEGTAVSFSTLGVLLAGTLVHHFLAGVIESIEGSHRHGRHRPTLVQLARTLPWHRLVVADLLVTGAIALGFAAFVVPGMVVAALTAITLPLLNMERRPVIPTLRRSARLTRHSIGRVLVLWLLTAVVLQAVQEAVGELGEHLTGSMAGEYAFHLGAQVVFLPIMALPVVVMAFDLVAVDTHRRVAAEATMTVSTRTDPRPVPSVDAPSPGH